MLLLFSFRERGALCICVYLDTCYQVPLPSTGGDCIFVFQDPISPTEEGWGWVRIVYGLLTKGGGVDGWLLVPTYLVS